MGKTPWPVVLFQLRSMDLPSPGVENPRLGCVDDRRRYRVIEALDFSPGPERRDQSELPEPPDEPELPLVELEEEAVSVFAEEPDLASLSLLSVFEEPLPA